jgi:uncharacterized protein (DUF1697 family)
MRTYISMLRGINVSGQKKIRMQDLRDLYASLGFSRVRSYVQSGNVIFESGLEDEEQLIERIEARIEAVYGFSVPVLLQGSRDFQRVLKSNPFLHEGKAELKSVYVVFLRHKISPKALEGLDNPNQSGDAFAVGEQEIFLDCPGGYGRTKFNNIFFERLLDTVATTRNWKTVNKLCELAG